MRIFKGLLDKAVTVSKEHTYHINELSRTLGHDDYRNHAWKTREKRDAVMNHFRKLDPSISVDEVIAILSNTHVGSPQL